MELRKGILIALFLLVIGSVSAGHPLAADAGGRISTRIYFRIGESGIDPDFQHNRACIDQFVSTLESVIGNNDYVIGKVTVIGTSSPDGDEVLNLSLAGLRAQNLALMITSRVMIPFDKIRVINGGENWIGLRMMIASSDMPHRDAMLSLMDRYPDDRDTRKHQMQYYADSEAWLWMYDHFFPALRMGAGGTDPDLVGVDTSDMSDTSVLHGSGLSFTYELSPSARARVAATADSMQQAAISSGTISSDATPRVRVNPPSSVTAAQSVSSVQATAQAWSARSDAASYLQRPLMALKSDLVRTVGVMPGFELGSVMPNLALEFYFARRWSVEVGGAYSGWRSVYSEAPLYSVSGFDLSPRFWFCRNGFSQGFFVGFYGACGTFDVQRSAIEGHTGTYYGGGVSVGYAQALSKHWYLELDARGGYRMALQDFYDIDPPYYYYRGSADVNKWIPSVRLNLIFRIGRKPANAADIGHTIR